MKSFYLSIALLICICSSAYGIEKEIRTAPDGFQWSAFEEDGYIGAKNKKGDIVVPAQYNSIDYYDGMFLVKDNSDYSIILKTGELFLPSNGVILIKYNEKIKNSPLLLYTKRKTWIAMDRSGKILVPEGKYGYLSIETDTVNNDYYFRVGIDGYHGIVDKNGKVVIPPNKYNKLTRVDEKNSCYYKFVVFENECNKSGVCDKLGREAIRTNYPETTPAIDKNKKLIFKVGIGDQYGYIDIKGNPIQMPANFKNTIVKRIVNGEEYSVIITPKGKMGLMKGIHIIIPAEFDTLLEKDNYIYVIKGNYWGVYDFNGNCIVKPDYYNYIGLVEGSFIAKRNGRETYLDLQGHELFPLKYDNLTMQTYGDFTAYTVYDEKIDKSAIFNNNDTQLTPFDYDNTSLIIDKVNNKVMGFYVYQKNRVGICDLKGNKVVDVAYTDFDYIRYKDELIIKTINGNKCGACKFDGTELIPAEIFDDIKIEDKKLIATTFDRKCVFTLKGKLVSDSHPHTECDKYIRLADEEFEKEKWSKAAKNYGKAIELFPSAALYYNKAISHYNDNNYKQAIEDFKHCLSSNPSQNLIDKSKALIAKAQELHAEKIERRNAFIGNLLGLALGAAATYAEYKMQSNRPSTNGVSKGYSSGDFDYLLDPNYAIQKVKLQYWNEYMIATNGGKTMSYDDWIIMRAQAFANTKDMDNGNYSSSTSDRSNANYNTNSINASNNNSGSMCRKCYGTGWCQTCEGKGYYYNSFDLRQTLTCPNCINHNGKCTACNGTRVR